MIHDVTGRSIRIYMKPISYSITVHSNNQSKQQSKATDIQYTILNTNIVAIVTHYHKLF